MPEARESLITGIGIVSCLGEGGDAHWQGLNAPPPAADAASFAPYIVHRIVPLELDKQMWDPLESTCRHASLSIL